MSFDHSRNTGYSLREFAQPFPSHAVSDVIKQHLDPYLGQFAMAAPKTRNERRRVVLWPSPTALGMKGKQGGGWRQWMALLAALN